MRPLWFGPEDRSLFGWLHVPEGGQARGGVLLSPTLGMEAVCAHYSFRRLADRLAEAGLVTLRFDYDGTGDSAGKQDDPGRVDAWVGSIRNAVDLLRGLGVGRVSVVAMRVGATLVAEAFGSGPAVIDDFVLWDPCASGRSFLREQRALWSFSLGAQSNQDGSIDTPGLVYGKDTVADLSQLEIAKEEGPLADAVLLLMRAGHKGDRRMNERLAMPHVERVAIDGQEELVDVRPDMATVPDATLDKIVEWLSGRAAGGTGVGIDPGAVGRDRAMVNAMPDGAPIEEQALSLGPLGLFGILTSRRASVGGSVIPDPTRANADDGSDRWNGPPTIVFLNAGLIDHVGPGRWWVDLARSWAEEGFRVLRFDLTGIGDSPLRVGQPSQVVFPPDALDDVLDVLQDVSPQDPSNFVLVGLCSGAYHAIEAAIANKVRGICAVNPVLAIKPGEASADGRPELFDSRRQASSATKRWARAFPAHGLLGPMVQRLPGPAWWIINRLAMESPPARTLMKTVDAGANVLVIAGDLEARDVTRGEGRTMRRLQHDPGFEMVVIPDLEHSLFERHSRETATGLLTEHVRIHYGCWAPRSDLEMLPIGRDRAG